ncbi:hypothetical protein HGRIS_004058 [Hohenbuehelia grisea]|uniref:Deacetylase sirtuin-type domain-containing protein n=1 Tax=Hohenbuehelia grisea TaxID=104357 RepID=A0ABR3JHF0_9AGAR
MSARLPSTNPPTPSSRASPVSETQNYTSHLDAHVTASVGSDDAHHRSIDMLALQIRAFLEASEEVDIDVETVEDLMQTVPDLSDTGALANAGGSGLPGSHIEEDEDGNLLIDLELEEELDISALYSSRSEVQQAWTKQEVRHMMTHLKEKGMQAWIKEYVILRQIPVPKLLKVFGINLCAPLQRKRPETMLYFLRVAMSHELRLREKLPQYNTIDDAVQLIKSSKRIIILTGAGISVSCGIPDFRSKDGLYASLKGRGDYDLDDPQQMFDITYFRENPAVFYSFARLPDLLCIYPSNFVPSPCHRFIKLVEDQGKLLRNYTQNIDTLETRAGVQRVLQCHGSFATATCIQCRAHVPGNAIEADIMARRVPLCQQCNPAGATPSRPKAKSKKKRNGQWDSDEEDLSDAPEYPPGIMKPDITFFGEKLTDHFEDSLSQDRDRVDLLLVIGTSLKVAPVSDILYHLPHSVPQILINKTPVRHINPDIVLLGNADDIVEHLTAKLGWELPPPTSVDTDQLSPSRLRQSRGGNMKKRSSSDIRAQEEPRRVGNSHAWLFSGADGGKWLDDLEKLENEFSANINGSTSPSRPSITSSPEREAPDDPREMKKQRTR